MTKPVKAQEPTPEHYEQLFQITLTKRERELLALRRTILTSPLDSQRAYLLKLALTPIKCPACPGIICRRSAAIGWDAEKGGPDKDTDYQCPFCQAKLTWSVALIGGDQYFDLQPGQVVTVSAAQG